MAQVITALALIESRLAEATALLELARAHIYSQAVVRQINAFLSATPGCVPSEKPPTQAAEPECKRAFTAAPDDNRCGYTIKLKDGSGAACMRRQCGELHVSFCWQHARKLGLISTAKAGQ